MEQTNLGGQQSAPATYDYRMYDRIWQRVSPDLIPYPEIRAAQAGTEGPGMGQGGAPAAPASSPAPSTGTQAAQSAAGTGGEANLPGAEMNPCCMGSEAQESIAVLEGFIEEELAEQRCCLALSGKMRNPRAVRLMRRIAAEKQAAAQEMRTAYFLITGSCYTPAITVERIQWNCLADVLRSCYHQEACNGFNYARASDETTDICLQKLFNRLSRQSYQRADDVMRLLADILC